MNKYILGLVLLFSTSLAFAQATDDNEINIDQEGDTLTLYIDQYGYGNKLGLDNFSSGSSAMVITGSTLNFNIDYLEWKVNIKKFILAKSFCILSVVRW